MAQYNFREWAKSLEARSSAEMFREGTRACGEAILSMSSLDLTGASEAAQFAKNVGQFLSWLKDKGAVKPDTVLPEDWQVYERIARSLVERGKFKPDILDLWPVPDPA